MKHSITELYKIVGKESKIFSENAVMFINHVEKWRDRKVGDCYKMSYKVAQAKPFRIYDDVDSKTYRLGWLYGEKTWFDSEEELKEYRYNNRKERPS